jgi:glutamate synthase (NADPH/NADH) small chain
VVGSGPPGLAAAQQLRRAGHSVTVYEKNDRIGGLMRYGIPNFKLEKHILDRRIEQMRAEGVTFVTNAHVGVNVPVEALTGHYDAILLCGGSEQSARPEDSRAASSRAFTSPWSSCRSRTAAARAITVDPSTAILATGKRVVIIGGGDTGADCLGTSLRQRAKSVHQFEIMPKPPEQRAASTPWPLWPLQLRTESSHEEGGIRDWGINSVKFTGDETAASSSCTRCASARRPPSSPSPAPSSRSTSIWSCWPWASWARALGHDRAVGRGSGQPRQRGHQRPLS